jgi:hypothetical protein
LTPLLEERIDERLGRPMACPHGNPVPRPGRNAATYFQDRGAVTLTRAPLADPLALLAVSELAEQHNTWLAQCDDLGLRPGARLTVLSRHGQDIEIQTVRDAPARLATALAARVWVVPADTDQTG